MFTGKLSSHGVDLHIVKRRPSHVLGKAELDALISREVALAAAVSEFGLS